MDLNIYTILPELRPYVKVICSMETGRESGTLPLRVLPDTCVELFINYSQVPLAHFSAATPFDNARSFVVFRMNHFMDIQMKAGSGCIAVCLKPGAACHFFRVPLNALSNCAVGIHQLWENAVSDMEERAGTASTNSERANIIQLYLIERLRETKKEDKTIQYCLQKVNLTGGRITVEQLSAEAGISQRQLGRKFNAYVGLTPKEFLNISRFISSLGKIRKKTSPDLTGLAYDSGYYDQAHFIHDYQRYAGVSPGQLLSSRQFIY